jgi:hypothetical protein
MNKEIKIEIHASFLRKVVLRKKINSFFKIRGLKTKVLIYEVGLYFRVGLNSFGKLKKFIYYLFMVLNLKIDC